MKTQTLLAEQVGWHEDVSVEEIYFETVSDDGIRDVIVYALDDEITTQDSLAYFYALNEDGFYWGHVGFGEYIHFSYEECLIHLMEYEDIDANYMLKNPKEIGEIITDNIIQDKDVFETFWLLKSYKQIYSEFPLIDQLREYLTDFYELYIPATLQPEEQVCAS